MIELHEGPDADAEQERQMLRGILDLGDVWVEDVMTHRMMSSCWTPTNRLAC